MFSMLTSERERDEKRKKAAAAAANIITFSYMMHYTHTIYAMTTANVTNEIKIFK